MSADYGMLSAAALNSMFQCRPHHASDEDYHQQTKSNELHVLTSQGLTRLAIFHRRHKISSAKFEPCTNRYG